MKIFETEIEGVTFEIVLPHKIEYEWFRLIAESEKFTIAEEHLARVIKVLATAETCEDVIIGIREPCFLISKTNTLHNYSDDYYRLINYLCGWM